MANESKLILTAEDRTAAAWNSLKQKGSAAFGAVEAAGADTARTLAATFAGVFGGLAVAGIYEAFITQTVEAKQLAVARARQRNIDGWKRPEKIKKS